MVLKNEEKEVKLDALRLKNSNSKGVNEYNLWNAIKIIITGTTKVNTEKMGGVVVKL